MNFSRQLKINCIGWMFSAVIYSTCIPQIAFCQTTARQTYKDVKISFELDDDMFPANWLKKPHSISAKPLKETEWARSEMIVKQALNRYPQAVLEKHLKRVYVITDLHFTGIQAGGTYWKDRVFMSNKGVRMGFTDKYLLESFHHEFSSILFRKNRAEFDLDKWKSANERGFKYGGSGTNAIKQGKGSLYFERKLGERGFINQYAMSSVEEDFNTISARLFTVNDSFRNIYKKYPRLRKKIDIAIEFYESIDPQLNKSFFLGESGDKPVRNKLLESFRISNNY